MNSVLKGLSQSLVISILVIIVYVLSCWIISFISRAIFKRKIKFTVKRTKVFLLTFIILAVVIVPLRVYFYDIFNLNGEVMYPELTSGDIVLVKKTKHNHIYLPGQTIIYKDPVRSIDAPSRIIAESGDRVSITNDYIFVNGVNLSKELRPASLDISYEQVVEFNKNIEYITLYANDQNKLSNITVNDYIVPQGKVFCLTDGRWQYVNVNNFNHLLVYSLVDKRNIIGYIESVVFNVKR